MKFDWQTVAVALIIVGAFLYVARRAFARLRSFSIAAEICRALARQPETV